MVPRLAAAAAESTETASKHVALERIFNGERDYFFHTRKNLRDYCWEDGQIEELFEDLREDIAPAADIDVLPVLELGTVMIVPDANGGDGAFEVHDGQQRLVTVSLLLAALRDIFRDRGPKLTPTKKRLADVRRIDVRDRDADKLRAILDGTYDAAQAAAKPKTVAEGRIAANYALLRKFATERETADLQRLLDFLMRRVYLQVMTVPNARTARLFVAGQRKGLDTQAVDVFKGMLFFYNDDEALQDDNLDRWEKLSNDVSREVLSAACVGFAELALEKKCKVHQETTHFDGLITAWPGETWALYNERCEPVARIVAAFRAGRHEGLPEAALAALDFLKMLQGVAAAKELEVVVLAILLEARSPDFDAAPWLHRLERVALQRALVPDSRVADRRRLTFRMARLEEAVFAVDGVAIYAALRKDDFGKTALGSKKATAILLRLDQHLALQQSQGRFQPGQGTLQLEHVLPQAAAGDWLTAEHLHKLGNLALLNSKANNKASNAAFSYKKVEIFGDSMFPLTRELAKFAAFAPADAAQRHARLVELVGVVFKLPQP
ncbi:hypothetical protein M885DRAFT_620709 [Pelagophyceae sp. CCMP2097]|nr:hypothetical protein M885DRAFT_620709 [Pelagophyceae sp. CCMP2097]